MLPYTPLALLKAELHSRTLWCAVCFSLLVILYLLPDLSSLRIAWIGDEWSFWEAALQISRESLLVNPFASGAHGYCSNLVSMYSALCLKLFGETTWSWRLSTLSVLPLSAVLLYFWGTQLYGRKVALLSSIIFCASFALQNFFILGYGNQLTLLPFLLTNILLTDDAQRGYENSSWRSLLIHNALVGSLIGIGFYFYIGIILPFICVPYWVLMWLRRGFLKTLLHAGICVLSACLWLIPLAFDPSYGNALLGITEHHHRGFQLLERAPMILWTFLAFFENNGTGYFVTGSFIDKLTAALFTIGLISALFTLWKSQSSALLLMLLLIFLGVLGLSHAYPAPPFQRCFVLLTISSILAGHGLTLLVQLFPRPCRVTLIISTLAAIILANQYRRELAAYKYGLSPETCLLMKVRDIRTAHPEVKDIYVITHEPAYPKTVMNLFPHYGVVNLTLHYAADMPPDLEHATTIVLNNETVKDCRKKAVPSVLLNIFDSSWANIV